MGSEKIMNVLHCSRCNNFSKLAFVDVMKLIMAILVVGIHTEPFGFNIWLDRGFGMITRLCVPFFFVISAYLYYSKAGNFRKYAKRILLLYIIWSLIYLPFDIDFTEKSSCTEICYRYLWAGNAHALWFLIGSLIGMIITNILRRFFADNIVVSIGILCLFVGCMFSTYSPLLGVCKLLDDFAKSLPNGVERCGLFYGFPYISLGMYLAKMFPNTNLIRNLKYSKLLLGLLGSFVALSVEAFICVFLLKSKTTILWMSVYPYTLFFVLISMKVRIGISTSVCVDLRRISVLIYVVHCMFIYFFERSFGLHNMELFLSVLGCSLIVAVAIVNLSKIKQLKILRLLY